MSGAQYIIVMGVSGSGKTTVGQGIAEAMGWRFIEGDEFHPSANVEKMSAGEPLTDEDRWPWLEAIGDWIDVHFVRAESAVITCSALRRIYRDLLTDRAVPVRFCFLSVDADVIAARLTERSTHFMPASLLPSQVATLEPLQYDEPGVTVSAAETPGQIVIDALRALQLKGAST